MATLIRISERVFDSLNLKEGYKKNVAIIAPHADDMEIGIGGTLARIVTEESGQVNIVELIITDSINFVKSYRTNEKNLKSNRRYEASQGAQVLSLSKIEFLGYQSVKEESIHWEVQKKILDFINLYQPDIVFIPHPEIDIHPTHRVSARLSISAIRKSIVPNAMIIAYPIWAPFPQPNLYIDITPYAEQKRRAINQHITQVIDRDYATAIIGLNAYYALGAPGEDYEMSYSEGLLIMTEDLENLYGFMQLNH